MQRVALVTYPTDAHGRYISERMLRHGTQPLMLNVGEFPNDLQIGLKIGIGESFGLVFQTSDEEIASDDIRSVLWRRPLGSYRDEALDPLQRYIGSESEALIRSLPAYMGHTLWISDPDATRKAGRKPFQLQAAQNVGFRIPKSVLGNSQRQVESFLSNIGEGDIILKAINSSFIRLNQKAQDTERLNRVIYTKRVTRDFLDSQKDNIPYCPFILQERITKDMDIRVTVVGERVFSMGIIASVPDENGITIDWRRMNADRKYSTHELPFSAEKQCVAVTRQLGLKFGCIDLAFSESEGYTFFEINPQGQWLVSEQVLGFPIADTLIELLIS